MSATATYDAAVSRVRIAATGLGASATYAVVDRTTNGGVTYTTVRGGGDVAVASQVLERTVDDYEFSNGVATTYRVRSYNVSDVLQQTFTADITPTITEPWLKFIAAPYLNRTIRILGVDSIARANRNGVFQVVGAQLPVTVTDVHGSRTMRVALRTDDPTEARLMDLALASGLPVFLHVPDGYMLETMYATVGDFGQSPITLTPPFDTRQFSVDLTECSAPAADVFGFPGTWQVVLNTYALWSDVLAEQATWATLAELIGDPSDVIVGG